MFQLKLALPLAAVVGVMLAGPAQAACENERTSYGANRDVERADTLIACLDEVVGKVRWATEPVFGTAEPGNPTFHELEERLGEFRRQFNISNTAWAQLMSSTGPIDQQVFDPTNDVLIDPVDPQLFRSMPIDQMTLNHDMMMMGQ